MDGADNPGFGPMLRYRYLFDQMVRRELRQKYKGSVLGVLWYLVNPLVLMAAYAVMFGKFLPLPRIPDYPLFLLLGIVVWMFFSQSLLQAAPSLIAQSGLVRKVRFPREIVPASVVTVQLVTFLVLLGLLTPVSLAVRGSASPALLLLPLILLCLFAFALGLALMVSVLHAHFRDVEPILSTALLPWFFITPIFFRPGTLPYFERHHWAQTLLEWVNPVVPFIDSVRAVLYAGTGPGLGRLVYLVAVSAAAVTVGGLAFRRMEGELAVVV
jgi:ABC-type polysaccharide/polyol phosphate export permease